MDKTHLLVTLAFDGTSETENIDTELDIRQDITKILYNYIKEKKIKHYVIADETIISEKLKN